MRILFFFLCMTSLFSAPIPEKVLICGVARNVAKAVPNTIRSATELGSHFEDYRIIIYENNSSDGTAALFRKWAKQDRRVIFKSEYLNKKKMAPKMAMGVVNRTEGLARARNIVLDQALGWQYDDFKYVIWVDLDFLEPWAIEPIVETILHPEQEWDAVFAYGAYDLFALRSEEWPIGFELVGLPFWQKLDAFRQQFVLDPDGPWKKVYSAFGGVGIYKRDALKGCRYSGIVTPDLEKAAETWLAKARAAKNVLFLKEYEEQLAQAPILQLGPTFLANREEYPVTLGLRFPQGKMVWFSCTDNTSLPWTCEHIPLHASMILKGHDRLFINPKIHSSP